MAEINFSSNKKFVLKRMRRAIEVFSCVLVIIAVAFTVYMMQISEKNAQEYLENMAKRVAYLLSNKVKTDVQSLAVLSGSLSTYTQTYSKDEVTDFLIKNVSNPKYHRLSFTYPNGTNIRVQDGVGKLPSANMEGISCFGIAMNGAPCFADTTKEPLSKSGFVNRYYVPVFNKNNQVVGVLGSMIDSAEFRNIMDDNDFNDTGFTHVIDSDGNYLIKAANETNTVSNFYEQNLQFIGTTPQKLVEDMHTKKFGFYTFKPKGDKVYVGAYARVRGVGNQYVQINVPKNIAMMHVDYILYTIAIIVLIIGSLLLYMLHFTAKLSREQEEVIYKVAFTDPVTEGFNKNKFLLDAKELLVENRNCRYAMIYVEIKKFDMIKELYGYKRSERILKNIYTTLKRNLTKDSVLARDFGGNFVVLYQYEKKEFLMKYFINKILSEVEKYNNEVMSIMVPDFKNHAGMKVELSFGIYQIKDKTQSVQIMCDRAALTNQNVKNDESFVFYDESFREQVLEDKAIEDEMYIAMDRNQYKVCLQPRFDMQSLNLTGAEALVRWEHPKLGMLAPEKFVPLFEQNGFMIALDNFVWKEACKFIAERKKKGLPIFPISLNVSKTHFASDKFISYLLKLTQDYDIAPELLSLQIPEDVCVNYKYQIVEFVEKMKAVGFKVEIDKFGSDEFYMDILRKTSVDYINLDRVMIHNSVGDQKGETILKNMINLAQDLKMTTTAIGVETQAQGWFLKNAGCKNVQGYLFGGVVPKEEFGQNFLHEKSEEVL